MKKVLIFLSVIVSSLTANIHGENVDQTTQFILNNPGMPEHYLLPKNHFLKSFLDQIFATPKPLENERKFKKAGFNVLYHQASGMRVASHPLLPGYLIKAYLNSEQRRSGHDTSWMVDRCKGAENIRNLIKDKQLKYFTVPDKWIYVLPGQPFADPAMQTAILIVTDMNLVSREESVSAWKTKITPKHLKELYCILSHGYASCYLPYNIPYTKIGTFSCIDTIYPKREHDYNRVKTYLSGKMREYWDKLVKQNK